MLSNFGLVESGFFRCAQPDPKGFEDLAALGVRTVIKLNGDGEYPLARERTEFAGTVLDFALSTFRPDPGVVRTIAANMDWVRPRAVGEPGLAVHCSHGRDRTGLAIGAWRLLCCGWTLEQVEAERRLYGNVWILDLVDREIVECLQQLAASR